jgi:hypothetical protein
MIPPAPGRSDDLDASPLEPCRRKGSGLVDAAFAEVARASSQLDRPGGDVRGLASGTQACQRARVAPACDRSVDPDDDVEREIPEGADAHRTDRKI